ncbi:TPA: hypothetical protein HA241_06255 [Candidatus Woesearchaeota archaeon]|nr:hypothetical protein [Candidatus Woesearchaeota archaeon]
MEPQGSISVNPINGYSLLSGTLQKNSVSQLTIAEINAAEFQIAGFTFRKIFSGSLTSARGQCTFQVVPPGANVAGTNAGSYDIKLELLKKDENAGTSCIGAVDVLPSSPQGVTVVSKRIRVQAQAEEVRIAQNIYDDFQAKNYNLVEQKARAVIEREEPDLDDAIARFYWVASLVARSESVPNAGTPKMQAYRTEIYSLLDGFFDNEASPIGYTTKATATAEYQKVKAYLCEIDLQLDKKYRYSTSSSINCEGYVTLCGSTDASKLNPLFTSSLATPPTNWENYVCRDFTTAETASCYEANCVGSSCKAQNNYYVPPDKFKNNLWQLYGCPGTQRCCPKS